MVEWDRRLNVRSFVRWRVGVVNIFRPQALNIYTAQQQTLYSRTSNDGESEREREREKRRRKPRSKKKKEKRENSELLNWKGFMLLFSILVSMLNGGWLSQVVRSFVRLVCGVELSNVDVDGVECDVMSARRGMRSEKKTFFLFQAKGCWCFCYFLALQAMFSEYTVRVIHTFCASPNLNPPNSFFSSSPPRPRSHNIQHHKSDPFLVEWNESE